MRKIVLHFMGIACRFVSLLHSCIFRYKCSDFIVVSTHCNLEQEVIMLICEIPVGNPLVL
jgi:hypothetical protein